MTEKLEQNSKRYPERYTEQIESLSKTWFGLATLCNLQLCLNSNILS